jgi:NodT family efflux transporter outer membrane factor (OMF) lipoprotein
MPSAPGCRALEPRRTLWRQAPVIVMSVALTSLSDCAVGPNFHHPAAPQTDRYTAQPMQAAPTEAIAQPPAAATLGTDLPFSEQSFVLGQNPQAEWWRDFGSSAVDTLIEQALKANPSMQAAEATLRQARENVAAQRGLYFPNVQASGGVSKNRDAVQVLSPTLASGAATYALYTPQLTVALVPDLFGANRRQVESLQALVDVSRYQYDAAYLTLITNVLSAAIQEAGYRAQVEATEQVIALERESLEVAQRELALGAIAEADVLAQDAALAQVEATLPPLRKSLDQQHDLLAVLTGQLPGDAVIKSIQLDELTLPITIPVGVPSQLVARRPDVRAADAQLHAATAAVGVAIANMLPQITLSGAIGNVATESSQLFTNFTEFWTIGASLSQTLFQGGTLYHRERAARAAVDVAGAQYRQAVLTAFQNVADTLRALAADGDAVRTEDRAFGTSQASLAIVRQQYDLGAVSYLALLSAQQLYQQAVIGRAQAQMNRYADTAALYMALGGSAPEPKR